ncbi:hypothetical protein RJT34_20409 [Clitoria ternatea]|uniref:Uncharacterized protein n=1 Tax=Clitoria ternatea TaxID=43366 RepID=A0AAN9P561_CLITE
MFGYEGKSRRWFLDTTVLYEENDRLRDEVRVNLGRVELCGTMALEIFSPAICQVMHCNPGMDLNLNGIRPHFQFHEGKLVAIANDGHREPNDIPFKLASLPPNQSMNLKETSSRPESARATPDDASRNGQKTAPPP